MGLISEQPFRGSGTVTGAFEAPNGDLLAVASTFPLLTTPPARAAYAGHRLRYRLALYRAGEVDPVATFDELGLPITAVAFHPSEPIVAIGAGAYDGGYFFDGDLVIWDWQQRRHARATGGVPQVAACRFEDGGRTVSLMVRPPDEDFDEGSDPFSTVYPLKGELNATGGLELGNLETIEASERLSDEGARGLGFEITGYDPDGAFGLIAAWGGAPLGRNRGPIFDVGWLGGDLGVVHDACLLEIYSSTGNLLARHQGEGHGVEIVQAAPPYVHVAIGLRLRLGQDYAPRARLFEIAPSTLRPAGEFNGTFTFAGSTDGWIVGRSNRTGERHELSLDVLVDTAAHRAMTVDLGHYDVFNHFLGVDGAPSLFILQGEPPTQHRNKHVCIVDAAGVVRPIWPVLDDDGTPASHPMCCCGAYFRDARDPGLVIAGVHHDSNPSKGPKGFIYRKSIDTGLELWRRDTQAAASAVVVLADLGLVAAAFLDESLVIIDADTGLERFRAKVTAYGLATIITALDGHGRQLAAGTIDGHIALLNVEDLLAAGTAAATFDLGD